MIVLDIARIELRRMFQLPLAWVILAAVQFLLAIFFYVLLSRYLEATQLTAGRGLTEIVVGGTLQIGGIVMLLVSPFLTMRLFSEEQRSGTLDLLLSSPVSLVELVLGKFLGVLMFLCVMLAMVSLMPLSLLAGTSLDMGQIVTGFLGLGLLMAAFAAVGLFMSTLTEQPAVAAVASFAALFVLWIIHIAGHAGSERMAALFAYLSLLRHFDGLLSGFFSTVDVAYFLLLIATFLALAVWRLDSVRTWR
ncbi:MAG TPA: ABC transporter permease [Gammaproteobacteria bacterium]